MRELAKYLKPYWVQCTLGPFCKLMEAILELILPTIMAYMINDGVVRHDLGVVVRLGSLMILMVFIGFGFSMVCQYNAALASQGFGTDMRNRMYRHIQKFSYRDIDYFTTSSLVNRISNDINQLQLAVAMLIRLSALLNPLTALVLNGAVVILLYQGVWQIQDGTIAPGVIVAFINYASSILVALVALSNLIVIFTKAAASAQRVNEVLNHVPSMQDGTQELICDPRQPAVCFDHVSFSYGDGENALSDISFAIHKGESIGIIGGTGAGKTTLIHLLKRFYDVSRGSVSLYGQDVRQLTHSSLCSHVVSVPQANELFQGTIRDNVCFGMKKVSDAQIWEALRHAQAEDFVKEKKQMLDAKVERGGANLSGGQRQRLCIARALLRKPSILILDDSCSALDFKTDALLRRALKEHHGDATRIIVSQRVSTLMSCDRILVLQDGRAVGYGTHEELYDNCETYRYLCQTQKIGKEVTQV